MCLSLRYIKLRYDIKIMLNDKIIQASQCVSTMGFLTCFSFNSLFKLFYDIILFSTCKNVLHRYTVPQMLWKYNDKVRWRVHRHYVTSNFSLFDFYIDKTDSIHKNPYVYSQYTVYV